MYSVTFVTPSGAKLQLGDKFTWNEMYELNRIFFVFQAGRDEYTLSPEQIDQFVEWYHTSFPDRRSIEHIVGGYLHRFDQVTMNIELISWLAIA